MTARRVSLTLRVAAANRQARSITGVAATFGKHANASTGPVRFEAGSLDLPADLSRVKLLVDHDPAQPVGYAVDADVDDNALRMRFHLPIGEPGDRALADAASKLRDGLSVGVDVEDYDLDDDTVIVHRGAVREVSLVAVPAIDDARLTDVAATRRTTRRTTRAQEAASMDEDKVDEIEDRLDDVEEQVDDVEEHVDEVEDEVERVEDKVSASRRRRQARPVTAPGRARASSMRDVSAKLAGLIRRGGSAQQVRAALTDIVPASDAGDGFLRPQWLGELWQARRVDRPLIDAITTKPLPIGGLKVYGFQFDDLPTVGPYAGDKTEIPSSTITTRPLEADVERTAGGWDIDRVFLDRGEPSIVEAIWTYALEDYLRKTEASALTTFLAAATAADGAASLPAALVNLGQTSSAQGSQVDFVGLAPDVWAQLATLTVDDLPWWMATGSGLNIGTATGQAGGISFFVNPLLPAGTVIAGDKRAATWFEDNPPVRVNAVDLPRGGVDLGLFGYHAMLVNDPRSIFRTTVTAPAPPAAE